MDMTRKRCLACSYNGDGHYTHCNVPMRAAIVEAMKVLHAELLTCYEDCDLIEAYKVFVGKMNELAR